MERIIIGTLVTNKVCAWRKRIDEKLDRPKVIASGQLTAGVYHVTSDCVNWNINHVAAGLFSATINIKVQMTDGLQHSIT